jgi:hypothetical protein
MTSTVACTVSSYRLESVTGHLHVQVLQSSSFAVRRKRRVKWQGQLFQQPDKAPSHISSEEWRLLGCYAVWLL